VIIELILFGMVVGGDEVRAFDQGRVFVRSGGGVFAVAVYGLTYETRNHLLPQPGWFSLL
jgi:hypothetical protein